MYSANKLSAELRHSNKKITDYSLKMIYIKYDKKTDERESLQENSLHGTNHETTNFLVENLNQ